MQVRTLCFSLVGGVFLFRSTRCTKECHREVSSYDALAHNTTNQGLMEHEGRNERWQTGRTRIQHTILHAQGQVVEIHTMNEIFRSRLGSVFLCS